MVSQDAAVSVTIFTVIDSKMYSQKCTETGLHSTVVPECHLLHRFTCSNALIKVFASYLIVKFTCIMYILLIIQLVN